MKQNYFLRTAACLLVFAIASLGLLPGAGAKYVAAAKFTAGARVATFSFVTNSTPFGGQGGIDKQFVVAPGESTSNIFTFPLFDTAYLTPDSGSGAGWFNGPSPSSVTVRSGNGDLVAAPGTGMSFGPGVYNTNNTPGGYYKLQFRNDSEVAVRYRLSVNSAAPLKGVPLYLYGPARLGDWTLATTDLVLSGSASTEWNVLGPNNGSYDAIELAFFWLFSATGYEGYPYGPDLITHMTNPSRNWTANSDVDDSLLGMLGADYLKGKISLDAASMKLELRLEVEQLD